MRRICIRPRFWLVLTAALALGFGVSSGLCLLRSAGLSARAEELQARLSALQERAVELRAQLAYVQEDEYAERIARKELNLLYPGDIRYISD